LAAGLEIAGEEIVAIEYIARQITDITGNGDEASEEENHGEELNTD
jgi:hypothetical protein